MLELIGGISNAIRGGQWRSWLNKTEQESQYFLNSDHVNALLFGTTVLFMFDNWLLAFLSIPAMYLGAVIGWGDYIGNLLRLSTDTPDDKLEENKFIDPLIKWLRKYPQEWAAAGLFIRGAFWGLCLAVPFYYLGYHQIAYNFLMRGPAMPLVYLLAGRWIDNRTGVHSISNGWGLGEVFWGVYLWGALK